MEICVIGGAGKMALGAELDFVEQPEVERIVLLDINGAALEERVRRLGSDKVAVIVADIIDGDALAKALSGCDVCLNATYPDLNVQIMEACLEAGLHYTDFGGLFHWCKKQLELGDRFADAGLTAVAGSGSATGIVNVMAGYAGERLDTIDSVRIYDAIVNLAPPTGPFAAPYALETLVREFAMKPVTFIDGDWKELEPFPNARPETVDFPEPIGRQTLYDTIHSEPLTIPISFMDKGIRNCSFKLSLPPRLEIQLRLLVELGLMDSSEVEVGEAKVAPLKLTRKLIDRVTQSSAPPDKFDDHKALRVVTTGVRDGREHEITLESLIDPYDPWHVSNGISSVGFPAAVTCRLLGNGAITRRGVFGSEACVPPEQYFDALAERNMYVSVWDKVNYTSAQPAQA